MPLITSSDYPAVRAAIDTSLDATTLPDSVIALSIFEGAAESEVLARDPLAAGRTGSDGQHVKNATVLLTAALLAPALPQLVSETLGLSYKYQRAVVDTAALAGSLRARASDELDAVLNPTVFGDSERPTMFTSACGRRGR